jgi:MoaA/NifB/PqqE/SkfB family radical SAM enzyme
MREERTINYGLAEGILRFVRIWSGGNPARIMRLWKRYRIVKRANRIRARCLTEKDLMVPPLVIFSVTMSCNLECAGCYSREYPEDGELSLVEIESLFKQAEALGVAFFVITGGEPLKRDGILPLLQSHPNLIFLMFTNGTYIDSAAAEAIGRIDNVIPVLSLEGDKENTDKRRGKGSYDNVLKAMDCLSESNVFFGFSVMTTRANINVLSEDAFFDDMIGRGCRIGFCIGYVPSARDADFEWIPTPEEHARFRNHILQIQRRKRLLLVHLPDDEYKETGSCMAAGRGFIHVNAQGYVEPCPFSHFASFTVRDKSLEASLRTPLFAHIRDHSELLTQPRMGCALYEHREELEKAAEKLGARSTEIPGKMR